MVYTEDILNTMKGKTIAVVGNGPVKQFAGKEIDVHDVVIRFNRFEIEGFEVHVGTKVTHVCSCREKYTHWKFDNKLPVFCVYSRDLMGKKRLDWYSDKRIIYARTSWYNKIPFTVTRPSSGSMVLFALHYSAMKTDAYGFDFLKTGHYFNEKHKHTVAHNQEYKMEEYLLKSEYITFHK